MEPLGEHNLPEYLTALAEGELDAATAERVRALAAARGDLAADAERLADAARRALSVAPPDTLRRHVSQLTARPARVFPWSSLAWAAVVAIAATTGVWYGQTIRHVDPVAIVSADVIPASIVARVGRIHSECSRLADRLHSAGYPTDRGPAVADVERDLHVDHPYPDLSSIEFRYVGAGPCGEVLPSTVHLLYKSTRPGSAAAVSLFVMPNTGQFKIAPGEYLTVSTSRDPFWLTAWQSEKVVYLLMADNETIGRKALDVIRAAAP